MDQGEMVFLSSFLAWAFGLERSFLAMEWGDRTMMPRLWLTEFFLGVFLILPASLLAAFVTLRIATVVSFRWIRSDLWTTLVCFVAADRLVFMWWMSVQCEKEGILYGWFRHGEETVEPFSREAAATLLLLRLGFMSIGVYLGQSFAPVALTGGIATGKSTVASMLQDGKCLVIDSDSIGHEILLPNEVLTSMIRSGERVTVVPEASVYEQIVEAFGNSILDDRGLIDRRKVGRIIFQDPRKRRILNRITHPRILGSLMLSLLHGLYVTRHLIVCADIPLLFETPLLRWLFCIKITVACDPSVQYQRLKQRDPDLSEKECRERIESQMPVAEKVKLADLVIWNNGDLNELRMQVEWVRGETIKRIYGMGVSLFHMVSVVGGTLSIAVLFDLKLPGQRF
jgi:dephospho-CoA kinase